MSSNAQTMLSNDGNNDVFAQARREFQNDVTQRFYDMNLLYAAGEAGLIEIKNLINANSDTGYIYGADESVDELFEGNTINGQQSEVDQYITSLRNNPIVKSFRHKKSQVDVSHYAGSVMQADAQAIGRGLSREVDQEGFQTLINAARAGALTKNGVTVHNGGHRVTNVAASIAARYSSDDTGIKNLVSDIGDLALQADLDDIDPEQRYLFVIPEIYNLMNTSDFANGSAAAFHNRDFGNVDNNLNRRIVKMVSGFKIIQANNRIPNTVISGATVSPAARGDFTREGGGLPVAVAVFGDERRKAVKVVQTNGGIETDMLFAREKRDFLSLGTLHFGIGQAHPFCAGSIEITA